VLVETVMGASSPFCPGLRPAVNDSSSRCVLPGVRFVHSRWGSAPPGKERSTAQAAEGDAMRGFHRQPVLEDDGAETSAPAAAAPDSFVALLEQQHEGLRASMRAAASSGVGQDAVDAHDSMVAALCSHLSVSATVLLPVVRRRLHRLGEETHALARRGRHLERELQTLQGRLHGDNASLRLSLGELRAAVEQEVLDYCAAEADLARQVDAASTPQQRRRLVAAWLAAARHAPTRPHPYAPHVPGLRHLVHLGDALWDDALDIMDNRTVPDQRPRRPVPPMTTWGRYLLGTPDFAGKDGQQETPTGTRDSR
jgi:hypothetical protein